MSKNYTINKAIELVFENQIGHKLKLTTTVKNLLDNTLDDFYEQLEPPCTSASCNNESQNHCDCGAVYEDYKLTSINI